jgi:hypothetical protein
MNTRTTALRPLVRLAVALSLAGALLSVTPGACAAPGAAPNPQATLGTTMGTASTACADGSDDWPMGPFPALTDKLFWIVLGLVVLGWLVLAADFPENDFRRTGEGEP